VTQNTTVDLGLTTLGDLNHLNGPRSDDPRWLKAPQWTSLYDPQWLKATQ